MRWTFSVQVQHTRARWAGLICCRTQMVGLNTWWRLMWCCTTDGWLTSQLAEMAETIPLSA